MAQTGGNSSNKKDKSEWMFVMKDMYTIDQQQSHKPGICVSARGAYSTSDRMMDTFQQPFENNALLIFTNHKDGRRRAEECLSTGGDAENIPHICKLRHPKTDESSMFLFCREDKEIYEITRFSEPYRSWFVDETIQEDGGLYMTTRVDATYLVLPYLIQTEKSDKFQIIDQIITDNDFPECGRLCSCIENEDLENVADVKGTGDIKAYRYSKTKTLSWLKKKVEQVADKLKEVKINVSGGAVSHVFLRSNKKDQSSTEDYERFAHGMISEYLPADLSQDLKGFMGIKEPDPPIHEKPSIVEPPSKKAKTGKVEPLEDYSHHGIPSEDAKNKTAMSAAHNKLKKVDKKGMKSISSFFSPKAKK